MHRIQLTAEQEAELFRRTRAVDIKPRPRDRLEMVRLCAAGRRVSEIACWLRYSERVVRLWLRRFRHGGFDALPDQPHPGRTSVLTPALLEAVRTELADAHRTWTARQVADWLEAHYGVRLEPDYLGTRLRRAGLSYTRTERTLRHKQDPTAVQQARQDLAELEKGGSGSARPGPSRPGRLRADAPHEL